MTTGATERRETNPPDVVLSAVANEQRRIVLRALDDAAGETMAFSTLVDRVADQLRADDGSQTAARHRQRVRTSLHHIHLPKLEGCGMIDHDPDTKQVRNLTGELGQELLTVVERYEASE